MKSDEGDVSGGGLTYNALDPRLRGGDKVGCDVVWVETRWFDGVVGSTSPIEPGKVAA